MRAKRPNPQVRLELAGFERFMADAYGPMFPKWAAQLLALADKLENATQPVETEAFMVGEFLPMMTYDDVDNLVAFSFTIKSSSSTQTDVNLSVSGPNNGVTNGNWVESSCLKMAGRLQARILRPSAARGPSGSLDQHGNLDHLCAELLRRGRQQHDGEGVCHQCKY
jgi:hypothetical protein